MSLEEMYTNAIPTSYVGTVKSKQEESATWAGANNMSDEFQTGFIKNNPARRDRFKSGGAQGIAREEKKNGYSRWTDKAFLLAFGGQGPATLSQGYYYSNIFRPSFGSGAATVQVHSYTPNNEFVVSNAWANIRKNSSPAGT